MKTFKQFLDELFLRKQDKDLIKVLYPHKYAAITALSNLVADETLGELKNRFDPKWVAEYKPQIFEIIKLTSFIQSYTVEEISNQQKTIEKMTGQSIN